MGTLNYVLLWALGLFLLILSVGLTAELRRMRLTGRRGEITAGEVVPILRVQDLTTLGHINYPTRPDSLLLLLSPTCGTCHTLLDRLRRQPTLTAGGLEHIDAVCIGALGSCHGLAASELGDAFTMSCDESGSVAAHFGVTQYPAAIVVIGNKVKGYGYPRDVDELVAVWDMLMKAV